MQFLREDVLLSNVDISLIFYNHVAIDIEIGYLLSLMFHSYAFRKNMYFRLDLKNLNSHQGSAVIS